MRQGHFFPNAKTIDAGKPKAQVAGGHDFSGANASFGHTSTGGSMKKRCGFTDSQFCLALACNLLALSACTSNPPAAQLVEDPDAEASFDKPVDGQGGPCFFPDDPTPVVDGKLTGWSATGGWAKSPHEYGFAEPVPGKFGFFYAAVPDCDSFYLLNDWYVRNDAPICPAMYNLFRFTTGDGDQQWEVRVFGDGKITILLNGKEYTKGKGGFSFGPSPNEPKPHTIFEFGVHGVKPGKLACMLHDPNSAAMLESDPGPTPGCSDPDAALLAEPTLLRGYVGGGGMVTLTPAVNPTTVQVGPRAAVSGQVVTIRGGLFGTSIATVTVAGGAQQVQKWTESEIQFVLGDVPAGLQKVLVVNELGTSNPITLEVLAPLACDDGVDCTEDRNEGPKCLHTGRDFLCDDGVACTQDTCTLGGCSHTPDNTTCADGNACTDDPCTSGGCTHVPISAPGCPCVSAGKVWCECTSGSDCDSGYCVPGGKGNVCVSPCASGCPLGSLCKSTGTENVFLCMPACVGKNEFCNGVDDNCNGSTDEGNLCDDGNSCTADACTGGKCVFTPLDSIACDDGNACTANDACSGGTCKGEITVCDDGNACSTNKCDTQKGCVFFPMSSGETCGDGSPCVSKVVCTEGGVCKAVPVNLNAPPCKIASCDPKTGDVTLASAPSGTACDDGNPDTVCDKCDANGVCAGACP